MGLQALRPSAAVCKVMTIPNSNCVRIVTPDEHVSTGFHAILVYDMGKEEWPQVPLSEIGCLRLDWPKDVFAFVGRYQLELEQMRKECRDRFGPVASGTCPTCEKYIQVNLGKHVALYHLDLAQLWRCPVAWCPVWKGTSQENVDHMRRAHNTGLGEGWKPGSMVSTMDSHSRTVAQYEQASLGSHPAFRGPYMLRLFAFLKESDAESIRRSHRRRAKEIASSMSKKTPSRFEKGCSDRYHFFTTVGSTNTGLEDHRSGSGAVSYTDGRQASAVDSKLCLPSVGRERYSAGTDGLVIATVF